MRSNEWATINVEKHHIELGKQNDCNECPIALAIREEMCGRNLVANVRDGEDVTLITKMDMKGVWAVVDIHSEDIDHINSFIHDFDSGIKPYPFSFRCQLNENQMGE